jgi:hypothetical protein
MLLEHGADINGETAHCELHAHSCVRAHLRVRVCCFVEKNHNLEQAERLLLLSNHYLFQMYS